MSENVLYFPIIKHYHKFVICIAIALVFLTFEKWTNTNTILTVGIVFQYNTSCIVHLWHAGPRLILDFPSSSLLLIYLLSYELRAALLHNGDNKVRATCLKIDMKTFADSDNLKWWHLQVAEAAYRELTAYHNNC